MKDRVPTKPGRVLLTPENGSAPFYAVMTRADEPTQEGDPLNKNTLLKDATAARFGLGPNAVPDEVLQRLIIPQLRVFAAPGISVTARQGDVEWVAQADENGEAVLGLPEYGEWVISAETNGVIKSKTVEVRDVSTNDLVLFDFADYSWSTIEAIASIGKASTFFKVGDSKPVTVGDQSNELQIIGFDHDDLTEGGKAGLTLFLKYCLDERKQINSEETNNGLWEACELRAAMPEYLASLPQDLQDVVKPVIKLTGGGYPSADPAGTEDTLFLLSATEIGSTSNSVTKPGEGSEYAFFAAGNTAEKTKVSGTVCQWWLRSPYNQNSSSWGSVGSGGSVVSSKANTYCSVAFALCI